MGNKVRIERICEFCGKTFIAKTCKTRFCCKACNDKYYKELIRSDRYNAVTKEVKEEKKKRIRLAVDELEVIQAREFISLKQLAIYLGVSRPVYNKGQESPRTYSFSNHHCYYILSAIRLDNSRIHPSTWHKPRSKVYR